MYFPYLRGRQFELIALRELLQEGVISEKIVPIIEPVKLSSTLIKTLEVYKEADRRIGIVTNPKVGGFIKELKDEKNEKLNIAFRKVIEKEGSLLFARILWPGESAASFAKEYDGKMLTICYNKDAIQTYENDIKGQNSLYNLILDDGGFRRKIRENRVLLDDKFNKMGRNSDYTDVEDEPFSEDHLYYEEDGYKGFSDYTVVGKEYKDTGFAPFAVAIHIVYFAEDKSLRVRHFVSDSNDDITDPAGKFQEAVEKLVEWNRDKKLDTIAMREFERLYNMEIYPGLGTVKKLSIMHHLELIGEYLDKE